MNTMNYTNIFKIAFLTSCVFFMLSCVKHRDSPGYEYMPDMYRSQAIEAYVDYGLVGDVEHSELKNSISARLPVDGTIPYNDDKQMAAINMPFNYGAGEDERIRAANEVVIPASYISDSLVADFNVKEGKKLANLIEGSQIDIIDNCGHMMLLEEADRVLNVLKKFITTNYPANK